MYELTVERTFSAAHRLRGYQGPCERLHGHNYRVQVTVGGSQLDEQGMLIDFAELKAICDQVIDGLDHQYLNDLEPFRDSNPSSENLARYIYEQVAARLGGRPVAVKWVKVWESATSVVTYRGE